LKKLFNFVFSKKAKMLNSYLQEIANIEFFAILSLIFLIIVFVFLIILTFFMKKSVLNRYSQLPFDENN